MAKKRHSVEQIIRLLRQAEVLAAQGKKGSEICREIGVSDYTYYDLPPDLFIIEYTLKWTFWKIIYMTTNV